MNLTADSLNSATEPVASVSELTVRYGSRTVLENLSLQVPAGCTGLLGPNGAGKTTLIKSLLGFVAPASGTGTILGCDIVRQSLRIRQIIGLMPEQECHIPGMNAVSFVAYAGELAGMPRAQALRRAHEVLEYCALGEARYRNIETYSTGMKQRIKLAQALVHGPKLLFLDEPTNGLDPGGRDEMLDLIRDVSHGKGLSVIVSSHLLPDIERTCDSVLVMKAGRLVTQGAIVELRQRAGLQVEVDLRLFSEAFAQSMARRGAQLGGRQGTRCRFIFESASFESAGNGAASGAVAPTLEMPDGGVRRAPAESELGRLIFEAAGESGVQVRGFRPAQRSLEDVFLEAMDA